MTKKIAINKNFRDGSLYLLANLLNKGIGFLTIPIFTRLMTTSEYGEVDTYLSVVALMLPVIGIYLGRAKRNAYVDFPTDLDSFDKSIFVGSTISATIITIIMLLIRNFLGISLNRFLVIACCIQAFMSYIIECKMISLLMEQKALRRSLLMSLPHILISIVSVILLINMDHNKQYGRMAVYFSIYLIFGGFIYISTLLKKGGKVKKEYITYAAAISIPLIFHGLAISVLSSSDRIMITYFKGASETGIYSLYYNVSLITLVLSSAIENVWIPWFTKQMTMENKERIPVVANVCTFFVAAFTIVMMMISPEIIKIMADKKYWGHEILIIPIIVSPFVMYVYTNLVNYEQYYKQTKMIARNTFIAALSNIILNAIFIPYYGAVAAAFTTLASYIILYFAHYWSCKKEGRKLFSIKYVGASMGILIVAIALFVIFLKMMVIRYIIAVLTIGVLGYVFITKKELLKK